VSREDESRLWTSVGNLAAEEGGIAGSGPVIVLIGRALQAGMAAVAADAPSDPVEASA
jgi:hypothetical protein